MMTMQEKLERAISYLRERGKYVLDKDAPTPKWGLPNCVPKETQLMKEVREDDRRTK